MIFAPLREPSGAGIRFQIKPYPDPVSATTVRECAATRACGRLPCRTQRCRRRFAPGGSCILGGQDGRQHFDGGDPHHPPRGFHTVAEPSRCEHNVEDENGTCVIPHVGNPRYISTYVCCAVENAQPYSRTTASECTSARMHTHVHDCLTSIVAFGRRDASHDNAKWAA